VWRFSRFGRNDHGIRMNLARLEHVGGRGALQSATEEADATTAVGRFSRAFLFDLAVYESDRAGEDWKDTHAHRRQAGLPATGGRRLGYIWHPRRIPDPHHPGEWILQREWYQPDPNGGAEDIASLMPRNVAGEGYGALSEWVNARGYRTRQGRLWQADSLRRYLDSGFTAGLLRVHDPECGCDYTANGGRCTRWGHIDGAHDALNTPEEWERYTENRARRRAMTPRARNPTYPLTGLVRCGACRGDAGATSARRRGRQILGYAYYCGARSHAGTSVCTAGVWVQRAVVEDEVLRWLEQHVAAAVDATPSEPRPTAPTVDTRARARTDRDRLQAEHDRLAAALTTLRTQRAMDPDDWGPGEYEAARDRIRDQQATVTAALNAAAEQAAAPLADDYQVQMLSLLTVWKAASAAEKNRLLRTVVRRVVCTREGRGSARTRVDVHPIWEPDPWGTAA
jgi:hypothetical protein